MDTTAMRDDGLELGGYDALAIEIDMMIIDHV